MPLKLRPPRPGKSPFWTVRGTHLGVHIERSTGFAEKTKARALLRQWRDDIERGAFARSRESTFLEATVAYVKAGGEARFVGGYDDATGAWTALVGRLGALPLSSIDQAVIDETALAMLPRATAATRNRQIYTPVSAILKHAGIETKIRRPKGWRGKSRTFWLWPEQAFRVFAAADQVDAEFGIFLRVLCYTGMRLSEACQIRIGEMRIKEGFAYLRTSKNDEPRAIHLPPVLVAALARHPRGLDRPSAVTVFRFRKNGRLYQLLDMTLQRAGVDFPHRSGFHTFCHTYATWMRRYAGLDVDGLMETGRWKDQASARRYTHIEVSEVARKSDLLPVENPGTAGKKRRKHA